MGTLLARHWWAVGLRGLVAIIFGILALVVPGITLIVLIALFGAYVLIDGVIAIYPLSGVKTPGFSHGEETPSSVCPTCLG